MVINEVLNSRPIDDNTKERILKQGFLYRGTNTLDFEKNIKEGFYYESFDRTIPDDEFTEIGPGSERGLFLTSTSLSLIYAMVSGVNRCRSLWYLSENAKPILLAIGNLKKYIGSMFLGLEFEMTTSSVRKIKIRGKISLEDIFVIDVFPELSEVCQRVTKRELNYFCKHYLR